MARTKKAKKSTAQAVAGKSAKTAMAKPVTAAPPQTSKPVPLKHLLRFLPWILVIGGVVGLIASVVITQEKFDLATNPHYQPICDLNPIISCGSVMKSNQAHAFGFMNPYIGLIGFPVVIAIGMAMFAGAEFKRWFWRWTQVGLTLGIVFAYWLLWQSVYRIRALCPWCLSVDVALTTIWWYVTLFNFYNGNIPLFQKLRSTGRFVKRHHADILVFWFVLVTAEILHHFWYYFGSHL